MVIEVNNKIVMSVVIVAGLAVIFLAVIVFAIGFDNTLAFLYEFALDILEKFLRMPERKVV